MLSFSTEFPVAKADCDAFIEGVRTWIKGSPHTTLDVSALDSLPAEGTWQTHTDRERLEARIFRGDPEITAAFRHSIFENELEWKTIVAYSITEEDNWVSIRTSRESVHPQLGLPPAKKPFVVRSLLDTLGGGLDAELFVKDEPHHLASNDIGMATRLINADAGNYLPAVFISRRFDGELDVDPAPLARGLAGIAHVLVEPDRDFSLELQRGTSSRNAYGGDVGVYWPSGARYYYFLTSDVPTEFDLRRLLVGRLRAALLNRRPLSRTTWEAAEAQIARRVFENLRAAGSDNVDEYIKVFDAEMAAKDQQLQSAEAEIIRLKAQVRSEQVDLVNPRAPFISGGEQEAFAGEHGEIIRDALQGSLNSLDTESRRWHVISSIIENLPKTDGVKERRERLKAVLRAYRTMDAEAYQVLSQLGFTISDKGKHYKVKYLDDDRYMFSLPKSGSDHRGGLNAASDIGKRVY